MADHFLESNLDSSEAEMVFCLIEQQVTFYDESYGMPGKGEIKEQRDPRSRILLRKMENNKYDIFYMVIGCGAKFFYSSLTILNEKIIVTPKDYWRESNPC